MEIEKGIAPTGFQYISFTKKYNEKITMVACDKRLRCALRAEDNTDLHAPFTHFTREEVRELLPYLQAFAETGTFSFPAEEPEDPEEEEMGLEEEFAAMQEAGIAMAANIADQGIHIEALTRTINDACEHIEALERLVREWYKFGQASCNAKTSDMLLAETEELLEEDQ